MIDFLGFEIGKYLSMGWVATVLRVAVLIFVFIPCVYILSRWIRRTVSKKYTVHRAVILSRLAYYLGIALVVVSVFYELGFSLAPLLGTAGIIGIALGFASQTSVSNVISGLFLITEEPFVIGDAISVGGTTGEVLAIDLLSIKLRTFDNRFVRIPNESIIKSEVTNLTRFPIRRIDVNVSVAYKEDASRVHQILLQLAEANPLALQEPEPVVIFTGFGSSSIDILFGVWVLRKDFLKLKNSIQQEIKKTFDEKGIEIPFPHLSLYTGSATEPFPVKVVQEQAELS
jgi:small-conductance mechanosensitive channel